MFQDKMTMLIFSCGAFSDLWDGHVKMLEKNWPDRGMKTIIVTDRETEKKYPNVEIFPAGADLEWSDRLKAALSKINTKFVFVTLDDYYLIQPVSNEKIAGVLDMMEKEELDYVRLFLRPKSKRSARMPEYGKVYAVDTNENYSVNLYAGIWRKSFLEQTAREPKAAWQYEVSLPRIAREVGAKCAMSNNREFVILDVVRKGKLLNHAAGYFKKHPGIYNGSRPVISKWYEVKLGIRTWGVRLMPKCVTNAARNFMIRRGHHYFSQEG